MRLSEWLEDQGRGFDARLGLIDGLLTAIADFHATAPGTRPALDPASVVVGSDGRTCELESAPRALAPATAAYRAPETNEGAPYAPSADTFSIGVLTYEILAGRHPFLMETPQGTLEPLANVPATPLRDVQPETPRDLADAIMACLERDPEWRAKDLSYLADVVKRTTPPAKASRGGAARKAAPVESRPTSARAASGAFRQARPAPSGSRLPMLLAAVAGMLALVGGLFWLTRPTPPPRETPRPSSAPATATPEPLASSTPSAVPSPSVSPNGKPTPTPTPSLSPSPSATASAIPSAAPSAASTPTPRPTATPLQVATPTPTPVPTTAPTPTPETTSATPPPNVPASVSTVVPNKLRRPSTTLLDVRGSGLRADHKAQLLRGRELAPGLTVAGQKYVSGGLVQVLLKVEDAAAPGSYLLLLVDAQGQTTNARPVEIVK